jgi:parallel beta-helix repeat protein
MKRYITAAILSLTAFACTAGADDWHVNSGESIQAAINNAIAGDTIQVHAGTYTENVIVNKTLTLQGDDAGVVTVQTNDPDINVFTVTADYVNISGFTVTGATSYPNAGIYLGNSNNSIIANNVVSGNFVNIFISHSDRTTLADNTVSDCDYGIYMAFSSDNNLTCNRATSSAWYGINLVDSSNNNTIRDNIASEGGYTGISMSYSSSYNTLINNTVNSNSGYCGILLIYSSDHNTLRNNTVNSNGGNAGIFLWSSSDNMLAGNRLTDNNDYGIRLYNASNNNLIYNNYFANAQNAYDDCANIWNTTNITRPNIVGGPFVGGNYWSDYGGDDTDGNGFGEAPHNIAGGSNQDHLPLVYAPATCGDITGDGTIDTVDLVLLLKHCANPAGNPIAHECTGDIDGNGYINSLDVLLLMGYINNPAGYSLNCPCNGG